MLLSLDFNFIKMKFNFIIKLIAWSVLSIVVVSVGIIAYIESVTSPLIYKQITKVPDNYVAIVFGAGIRRDGTPSKYLKDRLDAGIRLYNLKKVQRILLSGDNGSKNYDELKVMKKYMTDAGVSANDVFVDYAGFDTYSTVYRAKNIFKVDRALMVTQSYHLRRAVYIGHELGINTEGYAADKGVYNMATKNLIREQFAKIKAFLDIVRKRKPKYYKGTIDIHGSSNFYEK